MRKLFLRLSFFILFLVTNLSYAQLLVDAGQDSIFCTPPDSSFQLSGSALGGQAPINYSWSIIQKTNPLGGLFKASDFLSDTSISNPILIDAIVDQEGIHFILTASDQSGNQAMDTVWLGQVNWTLTLGYTVVNTSPGSTETITPITFSGGYEPLLFDWWIQDTTLGPQYDSLFYHSDPFPSRQVMIPNQQGPKPYYISVKDSFGCEIVLSSYEQFFISSVSGISSQIDSELEVFPNPTNDFVKLNRRHLAQGHSCEFQVINSNTQVVLSGSLNSKDDEIDLRLIPKGVYLLKIQSGEETYMGRIIRN